ncbi:MAG: methyltransferase domain-containing protein [Bacteroidota bacterium]|nr:methyltransferase domain-containing protein [Bacteroidota bacterium]
MGLYSLLTNNIIINNILIALKLDYKKELAAGQWKAFKYDEKKSVQQNAGFSHTPEVDDAIEKVKNKLQFTLKELIPNKSNVLDFGCGPGIYLNLLQENYDVTGVDVSEGMLQAAAKLVPTAKLYHGNFLNIQFDKKFNAIYSISVLEYVPVSQIDNFFKKCSNILENKGIIVIQYPHALNKKDLHYPDRNYINYSPELISKIAGKYFTILEHTQSFDSRPVCKYDEKPYSTTSKTFKNGYLLIAQKK